MEFGVWIIQKKTFVVEYDTPRSACPLFLFFFSYLNSNPNLFVTLSLTLFTNPTVFFQTMFFFRSRFSDREDTGRGDTKKFCQYVQESAEVEACGDWGLFRNRIATAEHDAIGVVSP